MSPALARIGAEHGEVLLAAALTVARTGLVVRVLIPRGAAVAGAARSVAAEAGVAVTAELTPTSIHLRFAPFGQDEPARPAPSPYVRRAPPVHPTR